MTRFVDSFGRSVALSDRLQSGGEGTVSTVAGNPSAVAKMFHHPPSGQMLEKLIAMVRMRSDELDRAAAWPIDLLRDGSGAYCGFLMQRMHGHIVDSVLHPGMQRVHYPGVTYEFLFHVAVNLMDAASALHAAGVVIGDVNERNVMVRPDGTIRFIDADSFQVAYPGGVGLCLVGTPTYTPAELQGADFATTRRTVNHDNFGLAVLLFQILMLGRHPFSGVPRRAGVGGSIDEAIRTGAFAYALRRETALTPPPGSLPLQSLGPLAPMFEAAFIGEHRPTAQQWLDALRSVRGSLRRCSENPRHAVVRESARCGLCSLSRDLMPSVGVRGKDPVGETVDELLLQANRLPQVVRLEDLFRVASIPVALRQQPAIPPSLSPEASRALAVGKRPPAARTWAGAVALLIVACAVLSLGSPCGVVPLGFGGFMLWRALKAGQDARRFDEAIARCAPYSEARAALIAELAVLDERERSARAAEERRMVALYQLRERVEQAAAALRHAGRSDSATQAQVDAEFVRQWRTKQLESRFIAQAAIQGIGAERTAVLQSFGIESAADVNPLAIRQISGFGEVLTGRILAWRASMEREIARLKPPPTPQSRVAKAEAAASAAVEAARVQLAKALSEYSVRRVDAEAASKADAGTIDEMRKQFAEKADVLRRL